MAMLAQECGTQKVSSNDALWTWMALDFRINDCSSVLACIVFLCWLCCLNLSCNVSLCSFAVFSSLYIVAFRKNKWAAADACWQANVTMTLIQTYARNFSKFTLTFSFFFCFYSLPYLLYQVPWRHNVISPGRRTSVEFLCGGRVYSDHREAKGHLSSRGPCVVQVVQCTWYIAALVTCRLEFWEWLEKLWTFSGYIVLLVYCWQLFILSLDLFCPSRRCFSKRDWGVKLCCIAFCLYRWVEVLRWSVP